MVRVLPFKAIRPQAALAKEVACLPYDVVNTAEAREMAQDNPYSYFHIDKSEIDLANDLSPYDPEVYQKAADNLAHFLAEGWLAKDEQAYFYLYQLTMDGRSQTGIVAKTAIDDYTDGKIKKHEYTRPEKEVDRINHILACDANTSPIFLSYRSDTAIQEKVSQWQAENEPIYDFDSYHGVNHKVWQVEDPFISMALTKAFASVPALYIADGHHRTESAVKVGLEKRMKKQASPESDYFLSIIFPDDQLAIWEYNRVLQVEIPENFLADLAVHYTVEESGVKKPAKRGQVQMLLEDTWYTLTIKPEFITDDVVASLDVSLLQTFVFEEIFGIADIRTDQRIDFVGGIRGPEELEKLTATDKWNLAFSMYPTQMADLLAVADAGKIMPPKSTWFEPKLLSGLFLHDLETKK